LTRTTQNIATRTERVLRAKEDLRDRLVWVGSGTESCCQKMLRLVEVRYAGKWYRYLTNVVDPKMLPSEYVVALYWQRWRIEDAFNIVKHLLGLAYYAIVVGGWLRNQSAGDVGPELVAQLHTRPSSSRRSS
jgi:hypothetical protein